MRTRAYLATAVLSICSIGVDIGTARAQDRDPVTESARRRFQEGVRYFDKGKFEDARASFLQAYALRRHPAVLLNLAQSELRSSHPVEAARHFAAFLRDASTATAVERAEAEKALAQLRAKLGRIQPTVNTAGAMILIDGEQVGESPLPEPVDAAVGQHTVEARLGDRVASAALTVTAGKIAATTLTLDSPSGRGLVAEAGASGPQPTSPNATSQDSPERSQESLDSSPASSSAASASGSPTSEETQGFFGWVSESPVAWIGLGATIAGLATFAVGGISGILANDNASSVHDKIEQRAIEWNIKGQNLCTAPVAQQLQDACNTWHDNVDKRDTDIKIAAVGAVVAGAGLVTTIVGYAVSPPKKRDHSHRDSPLVSRATPWIAPSAVGLTLQGTF